jgi:hypothetical protein
VFSKSGKLPARTNFSSYISLSESPLLLSVSSVMPRTCGSLLHSLWMRCEFVGPPTQFRPVCPHSPQTRQHSSLLDRAVTARGRHAGRHSRRAISTPSSVLKAFEKQFTHLRFRKSSLLLRRRRRFMQKQGLVQT